MTHENKTYVLTGVSSGVGAAVVADLSGRGAKIIGLDRVEPKGSVSTFFKCDLADPHQIDAAVQAIAEPIDGLVNIAGVPGSFKVETIAQVNYLAVRRLTDTLLPRIRDFGAVVNIASTAGTNWRARTGMIKTLIAKSDWKEGLAHFLSFGLDSVTAYDVSKEAVILYSMLASSRERHRGVRVNTVSPGAVQTPILDTFYETMGEDLLGRLRSQAGGRDARPGEMCGPIAFLLSQEACWVNGTDIIIDGGAEVLMNLDDLAIPAQSLSF
ncbi:coniferyl-alcohol dehydrogenase [Neorhizobium galegae]|uniref:coniferyl-alcohol dehydrogenase n=1 Tax=Neorhizobium galegae TaxID=399 RepID=UPI0021059939|nr:coniferyl-alcohol dehydrogenase [Neorhizobium galegae]MCQ1775329.1 coniferyl-alcohol dehydrogenase [Neorhizobium galegae]